MILDLRRIIHRPPPRRESPSEKLMLQRGQAKIKAFAAGGACRTVRTTPLLTTAEALEAMKKASTAGYRAAIA